MAINIFKIPFRQKEVFYDALEYQEIPVDEVFEARYDYGPKEEQILKKNIIINFFQTLIARLFQSFVYPGASLQIDRQRMLKAKHQLKAIGGKCISLITPDGDTLDGMHLKASDFKTSIEKYFYLYKHTKGSYNSSKKIFTLKKEFYIEEDRGEFIYHKRKKEVQEFIKDLKGLSFAKLKTKEDLPRQQLLFDKARKGTTLYLSSLPSKIEDLPNITKDSNPTVIISTGYHAPYTFYKDLVPMYLMRGINVMMVSTRGFGDSTGIPISYKTKLDVETAYQYLSKIKGVKNKNIIVHGHCQGAGSSTDLASRRKGVHLLVDRSFDNIKNLIRETSCEKISKFFFDKPDIKTNFEENRNKVVKNIKDIVMMLSSKRFVDPIIPSDYNQTSLDKVKNAIASFIKDKRIFEKTGDICAKLFYANDSKLEDTSQPTKKKIFLFVKDTKFIEKISLLVEKIISLAVKYDNIANLQKATGNIGIIIASNDEFISRDKSENLINSCNRATVITTDQEHAGLFLDIGDDDSETEETSKEFNNFIVNVGLARKVF